MYPSSSNNLQKSISSLLTPLFYSLNQLNTIVLTNSYTKKLIYFFIKKVILILNTSFIYHKSLYIYIFYFIFPRIIFALCLLLDCFYLKQLNTTYACVIIISLPLFISYLMTCMARFLEENVALLDKYFLIEITSIDLEDNNEEEDNDEKQDLSKLYYFPPSWLKYDNNTEYFLGSLHYQYLTIPDFIHYQSCALYFHFRLYEYKILFHHEREDYFRLTKKEVIVPYCSKEECEDIIQLSLKMKVFLDIISLGKKYEINAKILFILTFISLGCWSYILCISFYTLNLLDILTLLNNTLLILEEPFSGELLINIYHFYETKF